VQLQRALAQQRHVDHGTQAASDQALNFLGTPALFAASGLAVAARVGGARQHAILGRHPALSLALEKTGHTVLDACRANDLCVSEADENGALGVAGEPTLDAHGAECISRTAGRSRPD